MSILLHGDCLEQLNNLDDNSVDLIFCDLPYGQTSCKWDIIIPWEPFWKEISRVKKINTPIFFTTTTKFGVELINNSPKKIPFRYDIVWVKSAPAGFLSAKKMPLRKHEMIYVFYEKLPFYDLSSHTHKFIKHKENTAAESKTETYGKLKRCNGGKQGKYEPPLPVSVVKPEEEKQIIKGVNNTYNTEGRKKPLVREKEGKYETPLPVSVIKEVERDSTYGKIKTQDLVIGENTGQARYEPPLPVSVVKEQTGGATGKEENKVYSKIYGGREIHPHPNSAEGSRYDPPLPNSLLEIKSTRGKHSTQKPVALMEWILKYYSKEGDTILDPTMGSGSTGVACKNMNRNFIGIEKDPEIYEVAVNRIEN